jgi:hypothetical protein
MRIKWRRLNNAFHRDLGYFFFGMAIIYGLSGIALNHLNDWDPSYQVTRQEVKIDKSSLSDNITTERAAAVLKSLGETARYKKHYYPSVGYVKIFFDGGSLVIDLDSGAGVIEKIRKRPVFFEVNYLHYNNPKFLWTWFSDIFAGGLVVLAVTGLFMVRGKNGFKRRGVWFVSVGVIIPLIFLILYYSG